MRWNAMIVAVVIVCVLAAAGGASGQDCDGWYPRTPPPLSWHGMAFDERRGVMVVFGGTASSGGEYSRETWEWDGTRWRRASSIGPSKRFFASMCYDSERGVTVLFGGSNSNGNLGDTWEWNGSTWTLRASTGPLPRSDADMVFDPVRKVVVMSGGSTGSGTQPGTWEWNGVRWTQRVGTAPVSTRQSMFFDSHRGQVMCLVRGASAMEVWAYEGIAGAWSLVTANGPPVRENVTLAYDTVREVAVMSCGSAPGIPASDSPTWEWRSSEATWSQVTVDKPWPRNGAHAVFDSLRGRVLVFGGYNNDHYWSEIWAYDGGASTWAIVEESPIAGQYSTFAYDPVRSGGLLLTYRRPFTTPLETQLWLWEPDGWRLIDGDGPPLRSSAAMVFDFARSRLVRFGGLDSGGHNNDTWEWDGEDWAQIDTPIAPPARSRHSMAYDSKREVTVLFGGTSGSGGGAFLGDTWEWDGVSWRLAANDGPAPRYWAGMTFDRSRGKVVLVGGSAPQGASTGGLWSWDGRSWTLEQVQPAPQMAGVTAFDPRAGGCVFVPRSDAPNILGTWRVLDGGQWMASPSPLAVINGPFPQIAFDQTHQTLWLIGGPYWVHHTVFEFALDQFVCPGDVNGDGVIGVADLLAVIAAWNTSCHPPGCPGDVNYSGYVDINDLLIVISNWTSSP